MTLTKQQESKKAITRGSGKRWDCQRMCPQWSRATQSVLRETSSTELSVVQNNLSVALRPLQLFWSRRIIACCAPKFLWSCANNSTFSSKASDNICKSCNTPCIALTADNVWISLLFRAATPAGTRDLDTVVNTVCKILFVSAIIFWACWKFLLETKTSALVIISDANNSIRLRTMTGSETVDGGRVGL